MRNEEQEGGRGLNPRINSLPNIKAHNQIKQKRRQLNLEIVANNYMLYGNPLIENSEAIKIIEQSNQQTAYQNDSDKQKKLSQKLQKLNWQPDGINTNFKKMKSDEIHNIQNITAQLKSSLGFSSDKKSQKNQVGGDNSDIETIRRISRQYFKKEFGRQQSIQEEVVDEDLALSLQTLFKFLSNATPEQRMNKALRHFKDALYTRQVRNDLDLLKIRAPIIIYNFQSNPTWRLFLYILSWFFMFLTLFEPANRRDFGAFKGEYGQIQYNLLIITEFTIVSLFLIDNFMESIHKAFDKLRSNKKKYLNLKFQSNLIINFLFLADIIIFNHYYPNYVFIPTRILRPIKLVHYSKQTRRAIKGIFKSLNKMFEIILAIMLVILLFALSSVSIIGDLNEEVPYDQYVNNFNSIGHAINQFYALISFENYPDVMLPAITSSYWYLALFFPFMIITILLIVPIPISVMFNEFRLHRGAVVIADRIKEKEALIACFVSLDYDNSKQITFERFGELISRFCKKKLDEQAFQLFVRDLDFNQDNKITLDEFCEIIEPFSLYKQEIIEKYQGLRIWNYTRTKLNNILKLDLVVKNDFFQLFMLIIILINTVTTIQESFMTDDEEQNSSIPDFNKTLNYLYLFEAIVKMIGMGLQNYFSDNWNKFDFILAIQVFLTDFVVSFLRILRSTKTLQLGRLIKLSRIYRCIKIKSTSNIFKFIKFLWFFSQALERIQQFVKKIFLSIPSIFKMFSIIVLIFYIYVIIGLEIFHQDVLLHPESNIYTINSLIGFQSFPQAFLTLFGVFAQQWTYLTYDLTLKTENFLLCSLYFNSFNGLVNLILLSLLSGLIWEVFTLIDSNIKENMYIEQKDSGLGLYDDLKFKSRRSKSKTQKQSTTQQKNIQASLSQIYSPLKQQHKQKSEKDKNAKDSQMSLSYIDKIESEYILPIVQKTYQFVSQQEQEQKQQQKQQSVGENTMNPYLDSLIDQGGFENNQVNNTYCINTNYPFGPKFEYENGQSFHQIETKRKGAKRYGKPERSVTIINFEDYQQQFTNQYKQDIYIDSSKILSFLSIDEDKFYKKKFLKQYQKNKKKIKSYSRFKLDQVEIQNTLNEVITETDEDNELLFIQRNTFSETKFKILDIGHDTSSDESQPKKNHTLKRNFQGNVLLRRALIKEKQAAKLRLLESSFISQMYGSFFDKHKVFHDENIQKAYQKRDKMTMMFLRSLRFACIPSDIMFEQIYTIEDTINNKLLKSGSFVKIIFKYPNAMNKWFTFNNEDDQIVIKQIPNGPWNLIDDLSGNYENYLVAKDGFYDCNEKLFEQPAKNFFKSINQISQYTSSSFQKFDREKTIWDIYICQVKNQFENPGRKLRRHLAKLQLDIDLQDNELAKYMSDNMLIVSAYLVRSGLVKSTQNMKQDNQEQYQNQSPLKIRGDSPRDKSQYSSSLRLKRANQLRDTIQVDAKSISLNPNISHQESSIKEFVDNLNLDDLENTSQLHQFNSQQSYVLGKIEYTEILNDIADILKFYRKSIFLKIGEYLTFNRKIKKNK